MNYRAAVSLICLVLTVNACSFFFPREVEKPASPDRDSTPFIPSESAIYDEGDLAIQYLADLSLFGPRTMKNAGHQKARDFIETALREMGYSPVVQAFVTKNGKEAANIYVDKPGSSGRMILAGSHYDSTGPGSGVDDNASGVAVLLEMAFRLKNIETPFSIRFIFFDAEETGLEGSKFYASRMTQEEVNNSIVMVNLDSLAVGDYTYVYGNEGEAGLVRDWALDYARENGIDLITQPGKNPEYPAGTTIDASDHAPFLQKGIQYVYFEATNWDLGELDGYTQVDPSFGDNGEIWHTEYDTLEYITGTFPGRMESHLRLFSNVLFRILTEYQI